MPHEKENRKLKLQLERALTQLANKEDLLDKLQKLYVVRLAEIEEARTEIMRKNGDLETLAASLLAAQKDLEEDIRKRIETEAALRAEKEKAESATRLKDMFVGLVTHDLRAPIGNVIAMLSLLQSPDPRLTAETRSTLISKTIGNARALIAFIDGLLDINRLRTGKIRPDKSYFSPCAMTDEIVGHLSHLAGEKGVALHNNLPAGQRLFADPSLYREVLHNLVANAIKFTRQGDRISVFSPPGDPFTVCVEDTGVGIGPDILPDLLKSEVKTSTPGTGGESGTGLGLPYCHEIIAAHNGIITAESELGKGTRFSVRLRRFDSLFLIVDDNEAHRRMIMDVIGSVCAAEFMESENGKEALAKLASATPHAIITDINMPVMDGFTFISLARKRETLAGIPILASTSLDSSPASEDAVRQQALQAGANNIFFKPVVVAELAPLIESAIAAAKQEARA